MPTYFQGLPKASFGGLIFPAEKITLHSQGRQHVHEFPHSPAGAPEKLGRGVWMLSVTGNFSQQQFPGYPNLYPQTLGLLRNLYEQQITATFIHPSVGSFQAFITAWRQDFDPGKIQSGEKVQIEFLEDQRSAFLTGSAYQPTAGLTNAASDLAGELTVIQSQLVPALKDTEISAFQAIQATVNAITGLADTVGIYSQLYINKVTALLGLAGQVDQYASLQGPWAVGIVDSLHDLWYQAQSLSQQVQSQNSLAKWTVPAPMALQDIAIRLYGDASRQSDLLTLNANTITDPFNVRAGTTLLYFPPDNQPTQAPF